MANRRMFSKLIVQTDAFMEMPPSSQLLYFHLAMEADDDGFVSSPKKVMKTVGSAEDDYKILIAKRFIIPFESGVCVIKHWLVHNFIRNDRYTETQYLEEKSILSINKNGVYAEGNSENKEFKQIEKIERPEWQKKRDAAKKESSLPYSFDYKIQKAFIGKICPVCNIIMKDLPVNETEYGMKSNPSPTIQHNKRISNGGKHELGNISVICGNCNSSLNNKDTEDLNSKEVIEIWNTLGNHSAPQVRVELGKDRVGKDSLEKKLSDFDEFWQSYPLKIGKAAASASFKKIPQKTIPQLLKALEAQKASGIWKEPQYTPHASTWLNQRRWEDEIIKSKITPMEEYAMECVKKWPLDESDNAAFMFTRKYTDSDLLKVRNIIKS